MNEFFPIIERSPVGCKNYRMLPTVDSRCRRGAQLLVLKGTVAPIEDDIMAAAMSLPEVIVGTLSRFKGIDIGLRHGIDEVDLAGAQCGQAYRVLTLRFAYDFIQVGQVIPLSIGLPVVLK